MGIRAKIVTQCACASLAVALLTACTKTVVIEIQSTEILSSPVGREVSFRQRRPVALKGRYHSLLLTVRPDLRALIGEKHMDHAYYRMFACSKTMDDDELFSFPVLDLGTQGPADGQSPRYGVLVPTDTSRVDQLGTGGVGVDLSAARDHGLCFRLGGAEIVGWQLRSNLVRAPLRVVGDQIIAASDEQAQP